jgi:cytochrome P450 family 142 subfamily A polypeptide 1
MLDPRFRELDLLSPAAHRDPWEMYDNVRENDPIYWDPHNEIWFAFRHEDVLELSKNPEVFTSTAGNRPKLPPDASMLHQDGEQHAKQRSLIAKGFTPRAIRDYVPKCDGIVEELVSVLPVGVSIDFVERFAALLPALMIADMVGTPRSKIPFLRDITSTMIVGGQGPAYVNEDVMQAFGAFCGHHMEMVAERAGREDDGDLLSLWMHAEIDGEKLNESQLLFEHALLFVGGLETTRNAIAGGMEQLAMAPDQWAYLRAHAGDDSVLDSASEEMVRFTTPFASMFRTATKDVELRGKMILKGQQVGLVYPSANRDPRVFPDPHRFDVQRDSRAQRHLAFGHGTHVCLGRNLALLEMRSALRALSIRFEKVELAAGGRRDWLRSSFLRGPAHLDLVLTQA